jgi:hypothetical protein
MRIRYEQVKGHPNVLHSLTGLRPAEFEALVQDVRPLFKALEHKRLTDKRPDRVRAVGGGHPFSLPVQEQILLSVMWLRVYPTYEVLGFLFGITHPTVSRLLRRILPVLAAAGKDTMKMPDPGRKHRRSFDELLRDLPEFAVVIDTFEQPVQRPQGPELTNRKSRSESDRWYSGKKKTHTIKSQVGVDLHSGSICDVSDSVPGPTADITLLKQSRLMERLPKGVGGEGDLAYVGIDKLHPQGLGATPRRKPRGADKHRPRGQDKERPPQDVAYNRAFANRRIIVEHTLCRVRCYDALTQVDRHHRQLHTERVQAVCGLVNRKMQNRLPYLFN